MQIKFNVNGTRRKELVGAIGTIIGTAAKYKGPPTFAYAIGDLEVDKDGTLTTDDSITKSEIQHLLDRLKEEGFCPIELQVALDKSLEIADRLTIELPIDGFTETAISNLRQILKAKAPVIKAALGVAELNVEQTADTLKFPWFGSDIDCDHVKAYTHFITAICQMAKTQTRINAFSKDASNEKYAFRCFLLRLGFIGPEYKATRKILLSKLAGNSAFKNSPLTQKEVENE